MVTFKELVGSRIKISREAAGYKSQTDLANAMGISPSRVSDWETGKREPKGELKATLLRLLGVSESDIFRVDEGQKAFGKTVGEMSPQELVKLVSKASQQVAQDKEDLEKLRKENEKLKKFVPPEILEGDWVHESWQIGISHFFLTGDLAYLKGIRKDIRDKLLGSLRFHKFEVSPKGSHKRR